MRGSATLSFLLLAFGATNSVASAPWTERPPQFSCASREGGRPAPAIGLFFSGGAHSTVGHRIRINLGGPLTRIKDA